MKREEIATSNFTIYPRRYNIWTMFWSIILLAELFTFSFSIDHRLLLGKEISATSYFTTDWLNSYEITSRAETLLSGLFRKDFKSPNFFS